MDTCAMCGDQGCETGKLDKTPLNCPCHEEEHVCALFRKAACPIGLHIGSYVPGLTFSFPLIPKNSLGMLPFLQATELTSKPLCIRILHNSFASFAIPAQKANPNF